MTQETLRKEVINMKYEKPEIGVLESAIRAVQGNCPKAGLSSDSDPGRCGGDQPHTNGSAYEADE